MTYPTPPGSGNDGVPLSDPTAPPPPDPVAPAAYPFPDAYQPPAPAPAVPAPGWSHGGYPAPGYPPVDYSAHYAQGSPPQHYPAPTYAPPGYPGFEQPAYSYAYGYGGYSPYQPAPANDGLAVASLITSCIALATLCVVTPLGLAGVVGAILGHVSRRRIRATGAGGGGMALAGIIVGWIAAALAVLMIVGFILLVVLAPETESGY